MTRLQLFAMVALALAMPAAGQVSQMPQLARPMPVKVIAPAQATPNQSVDLIATNPEQARKTID
ncbi:MAG: hypothetical protein ABIP91_05710 [Sphingomicrobium sp.]